MSTRYRPWNPITAARAKDLNTGEDTGNLYLRYAIDPKAENAASQLEAVQRRHLSPMLQGHLDRWEMRAAHELELMHAVGVRVDRVKAGKLVAALDGMVQELERRLAEGAPGGKAANPKDRLIKPMDDDAVRWWLFAHKLPLNGPQAKMNEHLKAIEARHPIIPIIRRYRRLHSLNDAHPWLEDKSERIYPHHHHLCQATGRTTTVDPAATGVPKEMRPIIPATPGYELFEIDYRSMEVGVAAGRSGDARLTAAYRTGDAIGDIARIIFPEVLGNVTVADVKKLHKPLRDAAKPITYGTLYGQGPKGLADRTGKREAEAKALQDRLFGTCTAFKAMVERTVQHLERTRTVILDCGFERQVPAAEEDWRLRTIGANAPIQAAAGIIFRMASVLAGPRLRAIGARLVLPIHDAYVCEAPEGRRERAIAILGRAMEVASLVFFRGRLRLAVDVNDECATCWNKEGHGDSLELLIQDPAFRL